MYLNIAISTGCALNKEENMKFSETPAAGLAFAVSLALGTSGTAQTQAVQSQTANASSLSGSITQTGTAALGTPEYAVIRQFILSHPGDMVDPAYARAVFQDSSKSPSVVQVTLTSSVTTAADLKRPLSAIDGPAPPVPLPSGSYSNGATYNITISNNGYTQSWGYTYSGGGSNGGGS